MRIIIWGINYAPELTGIAPFNTGLCDYLRERGHEVEMVTSFPYYPRWKKVPGDAGTLYRTDDCAGVPVHRCWHYVPVRVTTLRRMAHELTFGFTSLLRLAVLAQPDVYIVVSPPLLLGSLAAMLAWVKRRPFVFHVQDLQPDAAIGLGMVKSGLLTRLLYRAEAFAYRNAAFVSGISAGMMAAFARKGVPEGRRVLFPNWVRWHLRNTTTEDGLTTEKLRFGGSSDFREKFGIPKSAFLASCSGNLGRKQGLETLLAAAEVLARKTRAGQQRTADARPGTETRELNPEVVGQTSDSAELNAGGLSAKGSSADLLTSDLGPLAAIAPQVLIFIIGDGVMRRELEARIAERGLSNVRMLPLLTERDYAGMLAATDASLILQAAGTGQFFFPSKLLSVLSAGSPVMTVADDDSELAKAVAEGGFGANVHPDKPEALAEALLTLASDHALLQRMRDRTTWVRRFSGETVLGEFEGQLKQVAVGAPPRVHSQTSRRFPVGER